MRVLWVKQNLTGLQRSNVNQNICADEATCRVWILEDLSGLFAFLEES